MKILSGRICGMLVAAFLTVSVPYALGWRQTPITTFPDHDVAYTCTPTAGNGAPVQFNFTPSPAPHFDVYIGAPVANGDTQNPVISAVTNTAGMDLLSGNVKLLAANNGLPLTVTASDNTGVVFARLSVDGLSVTETGNGKDNLPMSFYLRWNSIAVPLGIHSFRLQVWDKANNSSEKTWTMVR